MQQFPDLDCISAFVALADCASFSAAGRMLGRDPTIISRRVSALENQLGVRLVERTTRKVRLTEAGNAYLELVRPLLADLASAAHIATAHATGDPRGHLRVALPATFGRLWLTPAISAFMLRYPEVTVEAHFSNRYVDMVGEGYDVAVRLGALADSRLIARKIATRRRLLVASPGYLAKHGVPKLPADLRGHNCLRFVGAAHSQIWEFDGSDGIERAFVGGSLISDDAEMLLDAALADHGIAYSGDWLAAAFVADGRLVQILPDYPLANEGAVYVVTPSRDRQPSKTSAFVEWIRNALIGPPWSTALKQAHAAG
jgi:DNA-binding transcriptional LysR family regulator